MKSAERRGDRVSVLRRFTPRMVVLAAIFVAGAAVWGLQTSGALEPPRKYWNGVLPQGFPEPRVPASNPMSKGKVAIGRRLFYDKRLSGNGTQSCSSCHLPELAFTDGKETPVGSTGERLPRNAPSIAYSAYNATLNWGNPALVTLERQMEIPLFGKDPIELGITDRNRGKVLRRIMRDRWYSKRFPKVFRKGQKSINWRNIVQSISSFQRSVIPATSKYDRVIRGKTRFSPAERRGLNLFMGEQAECHHCHGSFIFNDQTTYVGSPAEKPKFHNTGLYNLGGTGAYPAPNRGVFEVTGKKKDMGAFRAPSLRNIARTAPYMHDGSVKSLMKVVEIYAAGGRVISDGPYAGDGRRNPFKDPLISGIRLTKRDQKDLVAFLRTLTDRDYSKDPRFADPFKRKRR